MMGLSNMFGLMFIPFFFAMGAFGFLIAILGTIFWLWLLVDCIQRKLKSDNEKIVWVIILILLGLLGAILYYFVVKVNKKKSNKKHRK